MSPTPLPSASRATASRWTAGSALRMALPLCAAVIALAGCRNNCQKLCHEMADYAAEECSKEWTSDEIAQCRDDFDEVDDGQDAVCEDITDTLREEWSCEEINAYFDKEGGEDSSDDEGSDEESEG